MEERYQSFQDLPPEISERLKEQIIQGERKIYPKIPEGASVKEQMRLIDESCKDPNYTEGQLAQIVEAFTLFNNAVGHGLPNQLYRMFVKALDTELAQRAYKAHAIWYAHEGGDLAKEAVQDFADRVKREIAKRANWTEEEFHKEYFLSRE